MRHLRWQTLIAVLGMALVVGMLAGQGRSVTIEDEPVPGGVYSEALIGSPRRLNPLLDRFNPVDRDIDRLLFSGLTRFDAFGRPVPDLANWVISDDELTYTFILRVEAKWHDGQPVTSDDVAFTLGLLQDPAFPGPADLGRLWQSVQVMVVNAQTIEFTLPEPFAPFLDYTAFGLLPKHRLAGISAADLPDLDFNLNPVGTGPFKFGGLTIEAGNVTGASLSAFNAYHGQRPLLNEVQFRFYADLASAFAAYERGDVLGVSRVDEAHVEAALKRPELSLYTSLLPEYSLIFLNLRSDELPFFQDKKVRQALLRGLNREAMAAQILNGQAVVANSPVLPGLWAYHPDLPTIMYDPTGAASLLDSAGWVFPAGAAPGTENYVRQKGGQPLRFTLITPDDPVHVAMADAARETWAQLGISVQVSPVDPAAIREQYLEPRPRTFQALLVDLNFAGTPDPDPYPLWHETQVESGQNYGGFADRVTSEILEQARITTNMDTRARLYYSFQSRFADQTPALLLFYPVYNYAVDAGVSGVQIGPLFDTSDRLNNLAAWSVVTRRVIVEQAVGAVTPILTATAPTR